MQVHVDWIKFTGALIYMLAYLLKQAGCARDDLPVFNKTLPQNITKAPGERVILPCRVHNRGTRVVSWRKKDYNHPITIGEFVFSADKRFRVDNNKHEKAWNLIIEEVAPEDKGLYLCIINTHRKKLEWAVQLNVKKKPKPKTPPAVKVTGKDVVPRGELLQLTCNASGPPDGIEWFKDGQRINSHLDRGIFITRNQERKELISVLVIKKSTMQDQGIYVCRSSNDDYGQISVQILNTKQWELRMGTGGSIGWCGQLDADLLRYRGSTSSCPIDHPQLTAPRHKTKKRTFLRYR